MLKRVKEFLEYECQRAKDLGVFVYWSKGEYVRSDGLDVCGYFCERPAKLTIATGNPVSVWLPVFVHESCHMDQWLEKMPIFSKSNGALDMMENWLLRYKEYKPEKMYECLRTIIELELDCEKRTVQKIKDWNLPIDVDKYIRGANVYLFFYLDLLRTRTWSSFYHKNSILECAAKTFYDDYSKIPTKLQKAFMKENPTLMDDLFYKKAYINQKK